MFEKYYPIAQKMISFQILSSDLFNGASLVRQLLQEVKKEIHWTIPSILFRRKQARCRQTTIAKRLHKKNDISTKSYVTITAYFLGKTYLTRLAV